MLVPGFRISDNTEIARVVRTSSGPNGEWSLPLEETANITPAFNYYVIEEHYPDRLGGDVVWLVEVGADDTTLAASQVSVPTSLAEAYLTIATGDARYGLGGGGHPDLTSHDNLGLATQAGVDAVDASAVHITGPETVTGIKTFSQGNPSIAPTQTIAATFDKEPIGDSGTRGFKLNRSNTGWPLGIVFSTNGVPAWDIALDYLTEDLVLGYDHSELGDVFRLKQGGFAELGRSVGPPSVLHRLAISSDEEDNVNLRELLALDVRNVASPIDNFWHCIGPGNVSIAKLAANGTLNLGDGYPGGAKGDLVVSRQAGTTPGSGAIFFGGGANYLFFTGTAFELTQKVIAPAVTAATGSIEVETADAGVILKSANGTRYKLIVQNDGTLETVAV